MIALIQRVNYASVWVAGQEIATIERGILAFIGVEKHDTEKNALALFAKIQKFRVFPDAQGKLNENIEQAGGALLLVPQFTLPADTRKGNRPGFEPVACPVLGEQLFDYVVALSKATAIPTQTGQFKAEMKVRLENDGPLTFWLQK
ncbi:D-aminoacyl-tRNA deacylase [Ostreibacterium oceani]|uniref:D-aminoacyl-tRNA deacylase n=1 Tax=Ostreibacterium oceani TaxID=2654998 RepID=A0A6N7EVS7_9GAMM|nr:D-aminoacyl-tRNA deacylase [Ostreibacterium oceani]MPV85529.1 D-tyrosyl-tRNA(Tyr) deacylase [Ostreibacterium oceani]